MMRRLLVSLVSGLVVLSLSAGAALPDSPAQKLLNQGLDLLQAHYRGLTKVDYPGLRQRSLGRLELACATSADCPYTTGAKVLDEALASLQDGHTFRLVPARYSEYKADAANANRPMLGLKLDLVPQSEALIVTRVKRGSVAAAAGIARGDVLWAINGRKLDGFGSASQAQDYLTALEFKAEAVQLELSTHGAPHRSVSLKPALEGPWAPIYTLRPDGTAFITFYQFVTRGQVASRVNEFMSQVRQANVRAVVVDLRGTGGGEAGETFGSVDALLDRVSLRFVAPSAPLADPGATRFRRLTSTLWNGQIFVLTNHLSRSAAEYLAAGLQPSARVTVIGEPTAGVLNSATSVYALMDGGAIAVTAQASADRPQRVTPGLLQKDDMDVLSRGRDLVLEQVLKILKRP